MGVIPMKCKKGKKIQLANVFVRNISFLHYRSIKKFMLI